MTCRWAGERPALPAAKNAWMEKMRDSTVTNTRTVRDGRKVRKREAGRALIKKDSTLDERSESSKMNHGRYYEPSHAWADCQMKYRVIKGNS